MKKFMLVAVSLLFALVASQKVMAQKWVVGGVYEQDSITPIVGATVVFSGIGAEGDTLAYQFVTDTLGRYGDSIGFGMYHVSACCEGYECAYFIDSLLIEFDSLYIETDSLNVDSLDTDVMQTDTIAKMILYELCHPVRYVAARHYNDDLVQLSWSMHDPLLFEDFETGDFSRFNWRNALSDYPWTISESAYEGNYCMRSACEGIGDGASVIEVPVYVPLDGEMSFYCRISSEGNWDVGRFYLDGVKKMELSGESDWQHYSFEITEGEHLFRWVYQKDASTDLGEDAFYVDCIRFYESDTVMGPAKAQRSLRYYDVYRRRADEAPELLVSHLTDTLFMEMHWNALPWGKYCWGVSCYYEGNRGVSDTIWSTYLDKDMTTTLEVNVTTNVGMPASGAVVSLSSHEGQGHTYQASVDANGHLLLNNVYRDQYDLRVHLDGYVDYVSDAAFSVMEPTQVGIELREALYGIDSLYVSSTGWATWSLGALENRDLQYYEIMLNGVLVDSVYADFYQFDVSQLNAGDTCLAQVRPIYLSGACVWRSWEWVYRPCSDFSGSANGVQWSLLNDAVQLSWNYPEGELFLGTFVYREGEFVAFVDDDTYLDESVSLHGEVDYCIRMVHDCPMDGTYYAMSCLECATVVFPAYCDPPVKLEGERYYTDENDYGALVSWGERPPLVQQWLQYDDEVFKRALGGDNEPIIFWSVRFEAEDLAEYHGCTLNKISLFDVGAGTYQLWIYVGGETAPGSLVWSQNMTLCNTHAWHEENIQTPLEIPENEPVWVVVGQQGLNRPAAACADMGDPNGRWVSLDGTTWTDMHTFNMHYTWMLRAFVSNRRGRLSSIGEEGYVLQHYNLYRSVDNADFQQVATVFPVEGQTFYQYRDVLSGEGHDAYYYRLTASYLSDEGETCESDFAASLYDPNVQYVYVDGICSTNGKEEAALMLYPNPSNGQITIEREGMQKILVYDDLGQLLLEKETTGDMVHLDLSGFGKGLYWIKVMAQDGAAEKPYVLARKLVIH